MMRNGPIVLAKALKYYGLKEVPGSRYTKKILEWLQALIPSAKDDGQYSWCGAFIYAMFKEAELDHLIPDRPAGARSWKNVKGQVVWKYGDPIELAAERALPGDLVIFWRENPNSWKGHVGIFISKNYSSPNSIMILGGNQSDSVSIIPYRKSRLLKIIRF